MLYLCKYFNYFLFFTKVIFYYQLFIQTVKTQFTSHFMNNEKKYVTDLTWSSDNHIDLEVQSVCSLNAITCHDFFFNIGIGI